MKMLDKYLMYSSVFALFTEDFSFHYIIDIKLYYLILISNFLIFSIKKNIRVHKKMLILFGLIAIHGCISYFYLQNPIKSLIAQLIGITISCVYYYNFIRNYGNKKVFDVYLSFSFLIALLAIPMYYLDINVFTSKRLNGILTEPAHYATIMLPAVYVFFRDRNFFKFTIIFITILLSKSSIGYLGLFLMLIIPLLRVKYLIKYLVVTLVISGGFGYYLHSKWNDETGENTNEVVRRLKETKESINAVSTGVFKTYTNLSTYALLSNVFVTKNIVINSPLGIGLGAYPYEYDKYYPLMKPPPYLIKLKLSKINRTDAASLFLRGLSDFGIFWLLLMLIFLHKSNYLFKNNNIIRQSTFFYLAVKLLREGHYFPPEFYFFLLIFLKDFDEDTAYS